MSRDPSLCVLWKNIHIILVENYGSAQVSDFGTSWACLVVVFENCFEKQFLRTVFCVFRKKKKNYV